MRNPLAFSVDTNGATPPFDQLRTQIAQRAASGELPTGTKLPPVRTLAAQVGVAANTAAKAYRSLEDAGVLEARGRLGTFIAARTSAESRIAEGASQFTELCRSAGLDDEAIVQAVRAACTARR